MNILISKEALQSRVLELGAEIDRRFAGEPYVMLVVLNGGMVFGADLLRALQGDVRLDSFAVHSYEGEKSGGKLQFRTQPKYALTGKNILLVDDIFDSGLTLSELHAYLLPQGVKSIVSCVLLDKKVPKKTDYRPDLVGFSIEPAFVIGYGLDMAEKYRNFPDIRTL